MEFADEAFFARRNGQENVAFEFFEKAFHAEKGAADLYLETNIEPTRSVLNRSAATLALDCGRIRDAEKLVSIALAGEPPNAIAEELRDLQEKVNFARHLHLQGISIGNDQLQITFAGKAIKKGFAARSAVFTRVADFEKLVVRTTSRVLGKDFNERESKSNSSGLFISTPRAASFSLTLQIGLGADPRLPNFGDDKQIIDELMKCMNLLQHQDLEALQAEIPDPAYFRNFIGLAKKIAPDGESISLVGLTSLRRGKENSVSFSIRQEQIPELPKPESVDPAIVILDEKNTISGNLLFADALQENQSVKLEVPDGRNWTVLVSPGDMEDVVRPYWGRSVVVDGFRVKKNRKLSNTLHLHKISPLVI